jgi:hypothetical protein
MLTLGMLTSPPQCGDRDLTKSIDTTQLPLQRGRHPSGHKVEKVDVRAAWVEQVSEKIAHFKLSW